MKTLVTANQKGGVGKTSTLVHLAFDFVERGMNVVVIDLDTQANASYTLKEYESKLVASHLFSEVTPEIWKSKIQPMDKNTSEPRMVLISADPGLANLEKISIQSAAENFKAAIGELEKMGADICLVDTPPSLGISMVTALLAADYVVSPVEMEAYSLLGIQKMVTTIANIRKTNKKLEFLGMLPSKLDSRNPRHKAHLKELTANYPTLVIPYGIGLRSSIADALSSGVPVWKIKKTAARKAAQEVKAFTGYIFSKMGMAA